MFAVPGWSVDASSLKQQIETPKDAAEAKTSRKRKRGSDGIAVTAENVGNLWEKHFGERKTEGQKGASKNLSKKEKRNRNREKNGLEQKDMTTEGAVNPQPNATDPNSMEDSNGAARQPKQRYEKRQGEPSLGSTPATNSSGSTSTPLLPTSKLTPLQNSMRQKLNAARFRHLNETLYTKPSKHSLALFSESPEMFEEYHRGFKQQVAVWPENPVDTFVKVIRERGAVKSVVGRRSFKRGSQGMEVQQNGGSGREPGTLALPRTHGLCTIADLGCGDASLASSLQSLLRKLNLRIHSFDLHASSPLITRTDIANLPLVAGTVDVAIICLALMGTNWLDFIDEAWRVLRLKGELWVAEIKSRFGRVERRNSAGEQRAGANKQRKGHKLGKKDEEARRREEQDEERELAVEVDGASRPAETDVSVFVEVLNRRGFMLREEAGVKAVDMGNKMFVRMEFVKVGTPVRGKNVPKPEGQQPGSQAGTWKKKPKSKFLEDTENVVDAQSEAKVLKPCVYKLR